MHICIYIYIYVCVATLRGVKVDCGKLRRLREDPA